MESLLNPSYNFPIDDGRDVENEMSILQLKKILKDSFKKSGTLNAVKARLRKDFIKKLSSNNEDEQPSKLDITELTKISIVVNYLKSKNCLSTISVMLAETGLEEFPVDNLSDETDLTLILKPTLVKREIAVQTTMTGPSIKEKLDADIHQLHQQYEHNRHQLAHSPEKSIEERIIALQREYEERKKCEIESQMIYFKENEIQKIRLDESQKHRLALESLKKELEADYQRRMQYYLDRETDLTRRMTEKERELDRRMYEQRQMMQKDIDDIRMKEQSHQRKLELEAQGLKIVELRVKEAQHAIEHREEALFKLQQDLDEKRQEMYQTTKQQAIQQVNEEWEWLKKEKLTLSLERKAVEESSIAYKTLQDNLQRAKQEMEKLLQQIAHCEKENYLLERENKKLKNQLHEDEQQLLEVKHFEYLLFASLLFIF